MTPPSAPPPVPRSTGQSTVPSTQPLTLGNDERSITLRIWRGDTSGGVLKTYEVPAFAGEVVLDVIHRVQATHAPDLAVRWNCKAGKCGSCAAEIDGRPGLMCMTRLSTLQDGKPVTVMPMKTFPIVRDLVTDVSSNYKVAKSIPPLEAAELQVGQRHRISQNDISRVQEFHRCIECFLCLDVCHVIRDHPENKKHFVGPRFFVRIAELEMHPIDTGNRVSALRKEFGLAYCNITKCCTDVCPAGIAITDNAIIPLKERVADRYFDPLSWLFGKLSRSSNSHNSTRADPNANPKAQDKGQPPIE